MARMTDWPTLVSLQAAAFEVVVVVHALEEEADMGFWLYCCLPAILSAEYLAIKKRIIAD